MCMLKWQFAAGLTSESKPVALPEMEHQLSQLSESVSLLLAGKPTPTDTQRAHACLQVYHITFAANISRAQCSWGL